ncbi:hypothetical protein JCM19294_2955 [Nonlabens tegetincola]|uniref:DUF2490 domain-containing protein n=1 Tax=Nonlabens tegetincola TaxID=323273 RepID=A0A090Q352_9FLAO|nr:DUF2490 domain-containing protein [Nonlabens tegetincola]GAK96173.1 hypothetical protein JCM19294_2955 [Nonlabens tegetincola]
MTSYYFRILIVLLLSQTAVSQIVDNTLFQNALNISYDNNYRWSFVSALEQRSLTGDDAGLLHIQASHYTNYEVGFYGQIGIGIMYRDLRNSNTSELRITEQYAYSRKYNQLKMAHRIRWDQRYRGDRITHRWRYRYSIALPLNGIQTDKNEWYLGASVETLFIAENLTKPFWDQRLIFNLGNQISRNFKLQLSTEYRWESFTQNTERLLFINLGGYWSL